MNCAWCSPSVDGIDDGICDNCMWTYFHVDPATIHQEIADEEAAAAASQQQESEEEVAQ